MQLISQNLCFRNLAWFGFLSFNSAKIKVALRHVFCVLRTVYTDKRSGMTSNPKESVAWEREDFACDTAWVPPLTTKPTADADEPQGHFSKGALVEVVPADGNGILSSGTRNIVRNTVESRSICPLPRKNFRCREGRLLPPFQNPQFQMTICPLWDHMVYVSQFLVPSTKKSQPLRSFDSGQWWAE